MTSKNSAQADHITMSSGGLYSLATKGAKDVIDRATPLVIAAVDDMNISSETPSFSMTDMGCADGGTSLQMVGKVLNHVKSKAPSATLNITYTDQPRNDFNALVTIVHGLTEFESYIGNTPDVFPFCSGASFYLQGVPNNTLDLGFSATAMHWLSQKPSDISNHIHMVGANGQELEKFSIQAAMDWQTILNHRAAELKTGGRLVLVNFCQDPQGQYLGNTGGVNMFDNFNQNWIEFKNSGRITNEEYTAMTLPQYYNSIEEFSAPLIDDSTLCHRMGLRLDSITTAVVRCPFAADYEKNGDVIKFADGLIPTIRSWNESTFFGALSSQRTLQERQLIIEDYYDTYRQQVLDSPDGHGMDYVHAYTTIRKV